MEPETFAKDLIDLLGPFLPLLLKGGDRKGPDTEKIPAPVKRLWSLLASPVRKDRRARDRAMDCAALPNDRNVRSAFLTEVQRLLAEDGEFKKSIEETIAL